MDFSEVTAIMNFLLKEEEFYKKTLRFLEQEYTRLHIEEYALKAAIRQEKINNQLSRVKKEIVSLHATSKVSPSKNMENKKTIPIPESSQEQSQQNVNSSEIIVSEIENIHHNQEYEIPQIHSVISNITDDRYLEPLVLNPHGSNSGLIEFDD